MDSLLYNGEVLTMDPANRVAEAVAIRDGKVLATGASVEMRKLVEPSAGSVDLAGRTVCPGFIDGHNHFSIGAFEPQWVDCNTPPLTSVREVVQALSTAARRLEPGRWLRGWGFRMNETSESRPPTRAELDEACPDHPLVLMDGSYHCCYVNSQALALAGIDRHTPDPQSGEIRRDAHGEPDGTLWESAMNRVHSASLLDYALRDRESAVAAIEAHCRRHLAVGITGVGDALVLPEMADLYRACAAAGRLPLTVHQIHGGQHFFSHPTPRLAEERLGDIDQRLRGGAIKMFMDTVWPSPAMDQCDQEGHLRHQGKCFYAPWEADDLIQGTQARDMQSVVHAIGTCAIERTLEAFERALRARPALAPKLRIDHFSYGTQELIKRTAAMGVTVLSQPVFIYTNGERHASRKTDPNLVVLPLRSLIEAGVPVAGSSDYPCSLKDPLLGMAAAVTRRTRRGNVVEPEEAITPLQALRMYTVEAARACGRESEEGSLEPGKRANLVVLAQNPLKVAGDAIAGISVEQTWVDGRVEWAAG